MKSKDNLIFVDIESTGLNPDSDVILEIAALPVSPDLETLDEGWSTVIHCPLIDPLKLDRVVTEMHTNNGLLAEVAVGGLGISAAQNAFLKYANEFVPYGETPLAGSSVHFDRLFLKKHMPAVDKFFHYRIADVSSVKEFWKRWFPEAGEPPKVKAHRALDDCHASVYEAKWYMERLVTTKEAHTMVTDVAINALQFAGADIQKGPRS